MITDQTVREFTVNAIGVCKLFSPEQLGTFQFAALCSDGPSYALTPCNPDNGRGLAWQADSIFIIKKIASFLWPAHPKRRGAQWTSSSRTTLAAKRIVAVSTLSTG
jgi:hypothetical protein